VIRYGPEDFLAFTGDTRDKVGEAVGMSERSDQC
jgi:hypothetical protein